MGQFLEHLPPAVSELIRTQLVVQYASVSAAGVPIDTPAGVFGSADLTTIDLATGVAYPAKAERARRNPKVGLLIEGKPGQPVVSIAGLATVRDTDLQANLDRYIAESVLARGPTAITDWSLTRQAIWYYTRMFVCITPIHIRWWDNRESMDRAPSSWRAPSDLVVPPSDPAPGGKASSPPAWPQKPWQEMAAAALGRKAPGHLTLLDDEGFPLPIGTLDIALVDGGFRLVVPAGAPWRAGKATLCFWGVEIFVGDVTPRDGAVFFEVERALPLFPLTADVSQVLKPTPENRAVLMKRLEEEVGRRGQAVPVMPLDMPQPTAGALYRDAALPPIG